MLTQERFEEIVRIVTRDGAATVPELARLLETSESTIRRDLVQLDSLGKVRKVHGGATAVREAEPVQERNMQEKYSRNIEDKRTIAAYAATLVRPNDFIFLDAGSTTEQLATYLTEKDAVYVTNGITLAQKLAQRGLKTLLLAGCVKATTDAVIGTEAVASLQHYNFSKGFFGTNGISLQHYNFSKGFFGTNGITVEEGFTTPDIEEAMNKRVAMEHCRKCYVLADASKFEALSNVSFGSLSKGVIITAAQEGLNVRSYKQHTEVIVL